MRRMPRSTSSAPSRSSVRRGERIARPLAKPGRIRRETLVVEYREDRRSEPETHRISPGTAFRRETSTRTRYYMFLGSSAEDRACLYFYELGSDKYGASIAYGLPERIERSAWVSDYEGGFSDYERLPLADAIDAAYGAEEGSGGWFSRLFSR